MPRCLMAKKWKAYPWPDRVEEPAIEVEEDEEIDVVGDSPAAIAASGRTTVTASCWGPSSPTAGATAPSPPPHSPEASRGSTILYNGYGHDVSPMHFTAYMPRSEHDVTVITSPNLTQTTYATLHTPSNIQQQNHERYSPPSPTPPPPPPPSLKTEILTTQRKSLSMCFTSTGAALSLPPKKKDIYRPYSLDDRPQHQQPQTQPPPLQPQQQQQQQQQHQQPVRTYEMRIPAEEDLHAAHAILDLSASTAFLPPPLPSQTPVIQTPYTISNLNAEQAQKLMKIVSDDEDSCSSMSSNSKLYESVQNENNNNLANINSNGVELTKIVNGKTVAYTYEAFFVSDGRSKKKIAEVAIDAKTKYTCTECGKQYATSSNLSRHKQTHRSLDSQAAKKCMTCGKAYVSMPALAMHVLTHKLAHSCGVCGKLFSRPWLLQGHLRSHTGEKPYGCAHCGKAFADRSNLRAHMQTHSADKNFECQRCHKTFALKSYLNKHLESACFKDESTPPGAHVIIVGDGRNVDSNVIVCNKSNPTNLTSQLLSNTNLISNSNVSTHQSNLIEIPNTFSG